MAFKLQSKGFVISFFVIFFIAICCIILEMVPVFVYDFIPFRAYPKMPLLYTADITTGIVSVKCLQCICEQESSCKPLNCSLDEGTDSCGYFQIKDVYWQDCGEPGHSLDWCSTDLNCSTWCIQTYISQYINASDCPRNCYGYARMHNGGPKGCHRNKTVEYWNTLTKRGCVEDS